jgi:hypothetical protein
MNLSRSILNLALLITLGLNLRPAITLGKTLEKTDQKTDQKTHQDAALPTTVRPQSVAEQLPQSQPMEHPHEANPRPEKAIDKTLIDKADLRPSSDDTAGEPTTQPSLASPSESGPEPATAPRFSWAIGANPLWSYRADYGAHSFRRFEPEAVGYLFQELPWNRLWLRHGARFGYSNDQPQMPKAMRVEESDYKLAVEEGLLWNWYIVPSLTAGIGYDWRTIRIKTKDPVITADNRLNTKDGFWWSYVQAGAGIPLMAGTYMIEPMIRRQHLTHDSRTTWALGLEMTAAF